MDSFKQLLGYIRTDFEIKEDEDIIEINSEFIKQFHKEFTKYQEQIQLNLDFLDNEDFKQMTPLSKWFKEHKEHENYKTCYNNLYSLLCISQDILGNEMIKGLGDINMDNIHESIQNIFSDNSPLSEMFENSPFADLFKNEQLKPMIEGLLDKLKGLNLDELMNDMQSGNFDPSKLQDILSDLMGGNGNNPALTSAMGLLSGMFSGGGNDEMIGMTPQQKASFRRDKKRTEYRRKIRAKEKGKKNNRKKRRG